MNGRVVMCQKATYYSSRSNRKGFLPITSVVGFIPLVPQRLEISLTALPCAEPRGSFTYLPFACLSSTSSRILVLTSIFFSGINLLRLLMIIGKLPLVLTRTEFCALLVENDGYRHLLQ